MISVAIAVRLRDYVLDVGFDLEAGRSLALVGPTGCGKTTTLRVIAGLTRPDRGRVVVDDATLLDTERRICLPPQERRLGVVFQDYALFPHMTVVQNVMYGARARGVSRSVARKVAGEALEKARLAGLDHQRPSQLSGGQQQRVALARALASGARAFLLDEPLSALDTATRRQVRAELRQLIQELGIQTIVVTHDPVDALTLGDSVCVMNEGQVVQVGSRKELLSRPRDAFVAEFMGVNLLNGHARPGSHGLTEVVCGDVVLRSTDSAEGEVLVMCFPWDVSLSLERPDVPGLNVLKGRVSSLMHLGARTRVTVDNTVSITAEIAHITEERLNLALGREIYAHFEASAARVYK